MTWHVYGVGPIDFGWDHLKTVEETARSLGEGEAMDKLQGWGGTTDPGLDEFLQGWNSAQNAARDHGWEGDFRHDPVVFWVPGESNFQFGFAFKQDNNGTTFVVSPVELPYADSP
ncbi:hypothetical protein [Castellaniella sp.]|uniref:hypothetical protein n=1 Tax=Castellaniella sp. TaxID=1955812 RepID=UPI002AFF2DD1|nr:hypothetical protein [Castellaniella sp.]